MIITERTYQVLKYLAIAVVIAPVFWLAYEGFVPERGPGDTAATAGDRAFADGYYDRALREYRTALERDPENRHALLGKAGTYVQMERYDEALASYAQFIERYPDFAGAYANRGIALDRMGRYEDALEDYDRALTLDTSVADGPGWLTRFLHMGPEGQPTVADRADYIREQLALPEDERQLYDPEQDRAQRVYTQRAD
ncbi:tetratricopeptide repeat protein [Methylonatrum kenyense]|uniref:tetratricopeptide repeat protein n=1 Tax=Methylonatrum kenyense TaxID=455253 RepID=UPI0020BE0013|nr:tetratricopeptide repeat protein [Methylonatrum kenyense]MCK8515938.1 tetratricopeptide repeat protein [Methylonatrum kenyense]